MIIYSIGVIRINDGLALCSHDEIKYNDAKLTEARKHREEICKSLSVFEYQRNSLYLSNSKYSIHWTASQQLNHLDINLQKDEHSSSHHGHHHQGLIMNHHTPHHTNPHVTPNMVVGSCSLPARSTYVVIALCENIKKHECEENIFKALDKVDKDFDQRFSSVKVLQAREMYQYNDFMGHLTKIKSRFQNSHSRIRTVDAVFEQTFLTSPINLIKEDFVIRLQKLNQKMRVRENAEGRTYRSHSERNPSKHSNHNSEIETNYYDPMSCSLSRHVSSISHHSSSLQQRKSIPIPQSSKEHNLKCSYTISNSNMSYDDLGNFNADSAIGSSITDSSNKTMNEYNTRILRRKSRIGKFHSNSSMSSNFGNNYLSAYCDVEFKENLNIYGYICLGLIFPCIALNFSRLWHIITHVGHDGHFLEDLEHMFEFFVAAFLCFLQAKLILVPVDCLQQAFGRNKVNWFVLVTLVIFQILLAEHRREFVTLFHVAVAIASSGVIHIFRQTKMKTNREMA